MLGFEINFLLIIPINSNTKKLTISPGSEVALMNKDWS